MKNGRFEAFDYGTRGNLVHYNQSTPPSYRLDSLGVPITVYWGGNDWLSTPEDIGKILLELTKNPDGPEVRDVFIPYYNHLDFVWGLDAASVIYSDIVRFFERYL